MKFRPHRGSLADAMKEMVELPPSRQALAEHLNTSEGLGFTITPEQIIVEPYGFDKRIGWDAYIVSDAEGVLGFTNGPVS